tara:strand:+ start:254 stop:601 length:348 start_codon:yes stop_codon:yes gene_type:complete
MRDIKFRAWNKVRKEWVFLEVMHGAVQTDLKEKYATFGGDLEPWQQHTGLKDQNGKGIWEGDIVKHLSRIENEETVSVIQFTKNASFEGIYQNGTDKVIGNIYENPELLENKKSA